MLKKYTLLVLSILLISAPLWAKGRADKPKGGTDTAKVELSTTPIGSPFLRHYAHRYKLDLKKLVQYERRGFGRTEIITLVEISSHTGVKMKVYGKKRLKKEKTLRAMAQEAKMEYQPLYEKARRIKIEIEALGDKNLPPPVFEEKNKKPKKEESKHDKKPDKKPD